jgi:hypothetical protein
MTKTRKRTNERRQSRPAAGELTRDEVVAICDDRIGRMLDDLAKRLRAGGHIPSNTGDACDRENWPTVHLAPTLYARLMERCRRFAATGAIDAHGLVTVLVNSAAQVPADPTNNDLDWNTELEYFDQILREVRGQQNAQRRQLVPVMPAKRSLPVFRQSKPSGK